MGCGDGTRMRARAALLFTLLLDLNVNARPAHASEPLNDPRWQVGGGIGGFGTTDERGGVLFDFLGLRRVGPLGFGLNGTFSVDGLRSWSASIGAAVGAFAPTARAISLGVVGIIGGRWHHVASNGLFSDDPGAEGTTGMFAVRTVTAYCRGQGQTRFAIGVSLFVDDDIGRHRSRSYTFEATPLLGRSHPTTTSHRFGTLRYGALFTLGATF